MKRLSVFRTSNSAALAGLTIVMSMALGACSNEDDASPVPAEADDLYTPVLKASSTDGTGGTLENYTGFLEALPCTGTDYTYYGNYSSSALLLAIPAYYEVSDGYAKNSSTPVRLPLGTYNMLYWGHPTQELAVAGDLISPSFTIGQKMAEQTFGLASLDASANTYSPTHQFVIGTQSVAIGTDSLHADLTQATTALNINISNSSGEAMNASIDSMWISVANTAKTINAVTGAATSSSTSGTVNFGLTKSSDSMKFASGDVYLFPSVSTPSVTIYAKLANGQTKSVSHALTSTLPAGTITTVNITVETILSSLPDAGLLRVNSWVEQTESFSITMD